jgi:hypothetical protein
MSEELTMFLMGLGAGACGVMLLLFVEVAY